MLQPGPRAGTLSQRVLRARVPVHALMRVRVRVLHSVARALRWVWTSPPASGALPALPLQPHTNKTVV